jgi:type II secretory pathway pseudopilin PulG
MPMGCAVRVGMSAKPQAAAVRGMTLVEIVLVTALLVVIGSLVVPIFTNSFTSVRLRRAGDQVLSRWAHARSLAIESGEIQQFRFTPESGAFAIEPWALQPTGDGGAAGRSRPLRSEQGGDAKPQAATGPDGMPLRNGTLPEPITFHSGQITVTGQADGESGRASLSSSSGAASTPILFFPDGTTSDASVTLASDKEQFLRLTLRGLTGVGRASDVLSRSELDRFNR